MNETNPPTQEQLPRPNTRGEKSLEEVIASRRSVREFSDESLSDAEISQLLWAAQGVTDAKGFRAAPSAGALYPLEIYIARSSGLFRYVPGDYELTRRTEKDLRPMIHAAALSQDSIINASVVFVVTAVYSRTRSKYGARAERYVYMEAGHAAQNLLLQAVALNLGGVPVAAFDDKRLAKALDLPNKESPLYLIPVGHPE